MLHCSLLDSDIPCREWTNHTSDHQSGYIQLYSTAQILLVHTLNSEYCIVNDINVKIAQEQKGLIFNNSKK